MHPAALAAAVLLTTVLASAAPLPEASVSKIPRWRGFNLLEKFMFWGEHKPYQENDFRMISELGFNFVRLPLDYRGYIDGTDWEKFHEESLKQIDQAVRWGDRYQIHVCINLHRAPGHTVAKPAEARDLWTDPEAQRVAALHWGMFARRYKGVPNSRLSFNLFNEPNEVTPETYAAVASKMLDAIRAEDPDRLVFCDGLSWGSKPVPELAPLGVAQMTRGYSPFQLTHYKADWVGDNKQWPVPRWPAYSGTNGMLLGPDKGDDSHPLFIEGPLRKNSRVRLTFTSLSAKSIVVVTGTSGEIGRREFTAGPDKGPWDKIVEKPEWKIYQAEGRVDMTLTIPRDTNRLGISNAEGDWISLGEIGITPPGGAEETTLQLQNLWAEVPAIIRYLPDQAGGPVLGIPQGREWLDNETVQAWSAYTNAGGSVMVGEWGAYNKTPHDVVLRWAEDSLKNWKSAGWGWALWNFRGDFGILDSNRDDVRYEDFHGHKLDRKLLDLLRQY